MKNSWVIITGGAGYLSYTICKVLLKNNYKLILWDINLQMLKNQKKKILLELGIDKKFIKIKRLDITNKKLVEKAINELTKLKLPIYALLNCASNNPQPKDPVVKFENKNFLEQWNRDLNVGLTGSMICSYVVSEYFLKVKNGRIINFSSDLGIIAPNQNIYKNNNYIKPLSYSVIKHGIIGMTKYFASLYGSKNLRYNSICFGSIYNNNMDKKFIKEISKQIPINRLGNLSEIEAPILFLLDESNTYMNGHSLIIDGGRTIW